MMKALLKYLKVSTAGANNGINGELIVIICKVFDSGVLAHLPTAQSPQWTHAISRQETCTICRVKVLRGESELH